MVRRLAARQPPRNLATRSARATTRRRSGGPTTREVRSATHLAYCLRPCRAVASTRRGCAASRDRVRATFLLRFRRRQDRRKGTPSMKNVAKPLPVAKMQTGIQGFDEITEGGLPCARTTLVVGGPGCGKTVFAIQ